MKKMRDGDSAGFGSQFLFILLAPVAIVINALVVSIAIFWCWICRKPMPLTPEERQILHQLQSLPPEKREVFLAKFGEKERESWRKLIESHVA
jgi:hypothetical protein